MRVRGRKIVVVAAAALGAALAACAVGGVAGDAGDDSTGTDAGKGDVTSGGDGATGPDAAGKDGNAGDASTCTAPMVACGDAGCVDTTNDPNHCGGCTVACTTADAGALVQGSNDNPDAGIPNFVVDAGAPWSLGTASCATSQCGVQCPSGLTLCGDGICFDTQNFHNHCGDCNTACGAGEYCAGGHCCASGTEYCSGTCTDVLSNGSNCGGCGIVCGTGKVCSGATCTTCGATNEALTATATSSGGGVGSYGPAKANDNILETNSCTYYSWLNTSGGSTTEWIQYTWTTQHTFTKIHVDTTASTNDACGLSPYTAQGAQVQWWNGSSWVTDGTVSNQTNDWDYTFTSPVTTTELRLYSVRSQNTYNAFIYEWQAWGCN
jgi:hypothetical protein